MTARSRPIDLLVVGAGPTGLTAALAAVQLGMQVRIVDQRSERAQYSKALVTHARTMEIFDALGVAHDIENRSHPLKALNFHGSLGIQGSVVLDSLDWGDTPFPHWHVIPQFEVENILETALEQYHVTVEWNSQFQGFEQDATGVRARLKTATAEHTITASWLLGADGAHSTVRKNMGADFRRIESGATFLIADAFTTAHFADQQAHAFLAPDGFILLIPLPDHGLWRIVAHLPGQSVQSVEPISAPLLDEVLKARTKINFGTHNIIWTSRFSPAYALASKFRHGRVFLAGDAAHIHSPVGAQGMNYGVYDAHNLIWKLAIADGLAPKYAAKLLNSYEAERRPVTEKMIRGVRRLTTLITETRRAGRRMLGSVGPLFLPRLPARQLFAQTMGGLKMTYRNGPLIVPRDPLSGTRATPAHTPSLEWHWQTKPPVQLIRPDGVVAASGDSVSQVHRAIKRSRLLAAVVEAFPEIGSANKL